MILRKTALPKASSSFSACLKDSSTRSFSSQTKHGRTASDSLEAVDSSTSGGRYYHTRSTYTSLSEAQKAKKSADRDFLVSVLETSVTKRDARAYIQKFVPVLAKKPGAPETNPQAPANASVDAPTQANGLPHIQTQVGTRAIAEAPKFVRSLKEAEEVETREQPFVAIVKVRAPQKLNEETLEGLGKTFDQLRKLGLVSVVVVDCDGGPDDAHNWRHTITAQANRIATAIDSHEQPMSRVIDSPLSILGTPETSSSPFTSQNLVVNNPGDLMLALQDEVIPIVPSIGYTAESCTLKPVDGNDAVLALTRQLSGLQFLQDASNTAHTTPASNRSAEVYRIIILDPEGGIPALNRATGRHLFLNLEQEYDETVRGLTELSSDEASDMAVKRKLEHQAMNYHHVRNLDLAKKALAMLPPTSSAVITSPREAANERISEDDPDDWVSVSTRKKLNPLIHNLLTDKPAQSSSLPMARFKPVTSETGAQRLGSLTTLAKRGMPLSILPDTRIVAWAPPQPGESRLKLTDSSVDLPRLVNLIEDSFGRKLDVEDYLNRVNGSLAGIIIAGEYDGGAILTWEKPHDADGNIIEDPARMVPYLDKFAVLKKSQGAGGVADIVFNAMVRDCFPYGVCWRSRKDNPVNKWYFERSRGSRKLDGMNWTMFWTTPDLVLNPSQYADYESVCRSVEPSWADKKHIVD